MKLVVVGGGGSRTPLLYRGLLEAVNRLRVEELVLHDVDPAALARVEKVLVGLEEETGTAVPRRTATDLDTALDGADFVVAAIRAGGFAARELDEVVALDHGVFGQETVGPGGFALAARNIPALAAVGERMRARCPQAWMINLSNPAGMVTQALFELLDGRVVGVCDSPAALLRGVARTLGLPAGRLQPVYGGLNHLGFLTAVWHAGVDVLPLALAHPALEQQIEEARLFGGELVRRLGWLPNEYLYFYERADQARRNVGRGGGLRGAYLVREQHRLAAAVQAAASPRDALRIYRAHLGDRHETYLAAESGRRRKPVTDPFAATSGYHTVALAVIEGLASDQPQVLVVNTANRGALGFLDADDVVEVPAVVRRAGVFPLAATVPASHRPLVRAVKDFERAAVAAILAGSAPRARRALALHPLVPDARTAAAIVDDYIGRIPGVATCLAVPA